MDFRDARDFHALARHESHVGRPHRVRVAASMKPVSDEDQT